MKCIAIVEDEDFMREELCDILRKAGFKTEEITDFKDVTDQLLRLSPDLILLDLMLPGLTGEEFIARLRQGKTMPIIVLSAKAGLEDRVNVLKLGADDFIPKPFDNAEVLARIEAQLRRYKKFSAAQAGGTLTCGGLVLDREGVTVTAEGKAVSLTAREFEILALLMEYPKKVFTREQIYVRVWGEEYMGDDNTVNVHISNLRSKLAKASDKEYIKTVWGIGFKMAEA